MGQGRVIRAGEAQRTQETIMTFGTVLIMYIGFLRQESRPSAAKYQQIYSQYFSDPAWADQPAESITRHDMLYFKQSHSTTPAQCSKALGLVKQAYNWVIDRIDPLTRQPLYTGANPAWRVAKHDAISRE